MKLFTSPAFTLLSSVAYFLIIGPLDKLFRISPKRNSSSVLRFILDRINKSSIAHRGGIPENTVTAFNRSKLGGAKAVEVDLQFTKDGHPVLFHDWTVDRVSDGSGHLHDMTLKEIQSLDVGYKFGHEGATVPTLYEAVDALKELDMYMLLELKDPRHKSTSTVIQLFASDPSLYDRIIVISFFPHLLYKIRKLDPQIIIGLNISVTDSIGSRDSKNNKCFNLIMAAFEKIIGKLLLSFARWILEINLILPDKDDILEKRLDPDYLRFKGINLVTWTVNSKEEKVYFKNVLEIPFMTDYITTEDHDETNVN